MIPVVGSHVAPLRVEEDEEKIGEDEASDEVPDDDGDDISEEDANDEDECVAGVTMAGVHCCFASALTRC